MVLQALFLVSWLAKLTAFGEVLEHWIFRNGGIMTLDVEQVDLILTNYVGGWAVRLAPSGHSDAAGGLSFWRCVTLNVIQSPITKIEISIIIYKSKYGKGMPTCSIMRRHSLSFVLLCNVSRRDTLLVSTKDNRTVCHI